MIAGLAGLAHARVLPRAAAALSAVDDAARFGYVGMARDPGFTLIAAQRTGHP